VSTPSWQPGAARPAAGAIYDRGYRHYQGPREGRFRPIRAILWAGIRRTLGIKRPWRTKLVPFGLLALAFIPAAVFVGARVLLGEVADPFLGYPEFFDIVGLALLLFAATAGPELLCPDRRERVLTLVFTRPVSRLDYLAGKLGALSVLMGIVALLPLLLVYAGNALAATSALVYVRDNLADLGRILVTGAALTAFYALLSLAVASLTDRRAIATASLLGLFLASSILANLLFYSPAELPGKRWLAVLALFELPTRLVDWMFARQTGPGSLAFDAGIPGTTNLAAMAVVAAAAAGLLVWRLRRVAP
jgi:ABC-2 type transport system permease protein